MAIEKPSDILWNGQLSGESWAKYYRMIHCPNKNLKARYYPDNKELMVWLKDTLLDIHSCPSREYAERYIMWMYDAINYIKMYIDI